MDATHPPAFPVTERTRLRRLPARGTFDRAAVYRILDEAFVCHVAFVVEGQPYQPVVKEILLTRRGVATRNDDGV